MWEHPDRKGFYDVMSLTGGNLVFTPLNDLYSCGQVHGTDKPLGSELSFLGGAWRLYEHDEHSGRTWVR